MAKNDQVLKVKIQVDKDIEGFKEIQDSSKREIEKISQIFTNAKFANTIPNQFKEAFKSVDSIVEHSGEKISKYYEKLIYEAKKYRTLTEKDLNAVTREAGYKEGMKVPYAWEQKISTGAVTGIGKTMSSANEAMAPILQRFQNLLIPAMQIPGLQESTREGVVTRELGTVESLKQKIVLLDQIKQRLVELKQMPKNIFGDTEVMDKLVSQYKNSIVQLEKYLELPSKYPKTGYIRGLIEEKKTLKEVQQELFRLIELKKKADLREAQGKGGIFSSIISQRIKSAEQKLETYAPKPDSGFALVTRRISEINEARKMSKYLDEWLVTAKKVGEDDAVIRRVTRDKQAIDMEAAGLEKGRVSIRNFAASLGILKQEFKDLLMWQGRWYLSKALLFAPLQIMGEGAKEAIAWQQAMKNAGAVSEYTAEEMKGLENVTKNIGKTTSVSSKEAAQALLEFAQAGIRYEMAMVAMPEAAKMVIATQEDMKSAVSALTTVINVWNLKASEIPKVSSQISAAMFESKLKVADLTTIFNTLANTAEAFNMSTGQTLTLMTALSKAGVMPSTIATGSRQMLTRLSTPTPRLQEVLNRAGADKGWTYKDFQIPQNDVMDVIKKLQILFKEGKITVNDFFKGFEVRAGATAVTVAKQFFEEFDRLSGKIEEKGLLDKAVAKSMEGLENQMKRFKNILAITFQESGVIDFFANSLKGINDLMTGLKELNVLLQMILYTSLSALGVKLVLFISKFIHLTALIKAIKDLGFLGWLAGFNPIISGISITLGLLITTWVRWRDEIKGAKNDAEALRQALYTLTDEQLAFTKTTLTTNLALKESQLKEVEKEAITSSTGMGEATLAIGWAANTKTTVLKTQIDGMKKNLEAINKIEKDREKVRKGNKGGDTDKPDKKQRLTTEYSLEKKGYEESIRLLNDEEKRKMNILENEKKLGLKSEIEYQKERVSITSEFANKKIAKEQELLDSLKTGTLRKEYERSKGLAEGEDAKKQVDLRYDNEKKETERKLKDIATTRDNIITDSATSIFNTEKQIYLDGLQTETKMFIANAEDIKNAEIWKTSEIEKQYRWLFDKNKINAEQYYTFRKAQIESDSKNELKVLADKVDEEMITMLSEWAMYEEGHERRIKLNDEMNVLENQAAIDSLKIERDRLTKLAELQREMLDSPRARYETQGVGGIFGLEIENLNAQFGNIGQNLLEAMDGIAQGMYDGFKTFFFDAMTGQLKTFEDYIKSFANSVANTLSQLASQMLMKGIFGGIGSLLGTGLNMTGITLGGGMGVTGPTDSLGFMASGGSVSLNKRYIVGEKGPELFVPKSNGTIIPNNALGGSPNVAVNVINQTGTNATAEQQGNIRFDGDKYIIDVVMKKYNSSLEFRNMMRGR